MNGLRAMSEIIGDIDRLDQHAECMAKALTLHNVDFSVKTCASVANAKKEAYWLNFQVDGNDFLYRSGVMLDPNKDGRGGRGRNINYRSAILVADKHATKQHLHSHGFSVPRGRTFRRRDRHKALEYFGQRAEPLCVKPNNGRMGDRVTSGITDFEQYQNALDYVAEKYVNIVVEEHVQGEHFRFFYVEPNVIGIRQGIPLSVVGDGVSSIATLLDVKNQQRRARQLVTHPEVEIDSQIRDFLKPQGLEPESIIAKGSRVFLRSSGGHSAAADTLLIDPADIHPDYLNIVAAACQSVPGLYYSGVDIVIKDKYQPATQDNYWFIELNANPGLSPFYYPWQGATVDIGGHLLSLLSRHYPFD